jgi:hypothetical protein
MPRPAPDTVPEPAAPRSLSLRARSSVIIALSSAGCPFSSSMSGVDIPVFWMVHPVGNRGPFSNGPDEVSLLRSAHSPSLPCLPRGSDEANVFDLF